ncbi:MAG: carboxy terminal-processing peptidase [Neptuniibacter sp.]
MSRSSVIKTLLVSTLSLLISHTAFAVSTSLASEPIHKNTLHEITESLNLRHYKDLMLDDDLSSQILDQYLKDLDPARSYFLSSDVEEFNQYRFSLDDQIQEGDLETAYSIFNRFHERLEERINYSINLLESDKEFDFSLSESLDTDRESAPWMTSEEEINDLWRRRIKSSLLNLKLADKDIKEARELLIKRYQNQLNRATQVNSEDVFQMFTNAYTKQYDPHTVYMSPRKSENFKINMSLSFEGIGAVLQTENEFTQIVRLIPGGPAEKTGGLKATDRIIGVGQGTEGEIEDVVGWRLEDVVDLIRGPKSTTVRLEIRSAEQDDAPSKIVDIIRNKIELEEQAAQKKILELDHLGRQFRLGVIEIPAFYINFDALQSGDENYKSTSRDVAALIEELKEEGIDGLIVDLRNNGGGSLREANDTVGLFIKHGPTVQIKDSTGRVDILRDRSSEVAYSGPLAVLVNRLSASASEIFAGAIQDYNRGIVIGGQTFGKGTVQTLLPLSHGQLKLTQAKFYRISGGSTQHKGVMPDIYFPTLYDPEVIGESALDNALAWDTVKTARHGNYPAFDQFINQVDTRYKERTLNDPDFIFMREQVEYVSEARNEDSAIPLQEEQLKLEREEAKQWQIDAENRRRALKNLEPIAELSELDEEREKDSEGRPINPETEAMLKESGRILLDAIIMQLQYSAVSSEKQ